ncbi:MAG: Ig-like domain-containing protein [Cyclobacteriaceae bacterium]|nr:Ig-like domain-containing protein [Cyclobacteriaceae bacterium]
MYRLFISVFIIAIWGACANRVPPTGGPKDEDPPKLMGSIPKDGNINVRTTEITLLFDELVVTKNIKKELLITPRIDFDYEYSIKKNTVIIELEEPLDSATTYTFNFRNSIVDITEANPAVDLILAFSTGPILDTLQINGNINDLFTENPIENLVVGLYKADDTLNLFNSPPYYLAQTDEQGNYIFRNLKSAEYIINAFGDSNNNLMCESSREPYAFTNNSIKLDSTITADTLKLQSLNIDSLQLKRTRNSGQYFIAITNKYLTNIALNASNDSTIWYTLDKDHKEIKIYNTFSIKDSLLVNIAIEDSLYIQTTDSFYLKFPPSERKYDKYNVKLNELELFPERRSISFIINTSKPSYFLSADSISIKVDTLSTILFDSTWNITTNKNATEFKFVNVLPQAYLDSIQTNDVNKSTSGSSRGERISTNIEKKGNVNLKIETGSSTNLSYSLRLPFASFLSIESDSSEQIENKLTPKYAKNFGVLKGNISTEHTHYIIQLIDNNFDVVKEITQTTKYKFRHVSPGDYRIRILIDSNKNGKWDAGNILLNQLPEPILIYKNEEGNKKTTIRANWEISLDLTF